jgi:hypothetical protein
MGSHFATFLAPSEMLLFLRRKLFVFVERHSIRAVGFIDWLGLGFVANHFDVVPVRTNDESCIVVRVVVRAQTRCTIVFATRLQSRAIESFDLLAILGRERQVKMRWLLLGLVQAPHPYFGSNPG